MTALSSVIQFPVYSSALSKSSDHEGREDTCMRSPAAPVPGYKNLQQLVNAAKQVLDYYGPVVEEQAPEVKERDLFTGLERALAPYLREQQAREQHYNQRASRKLRVVSKDEVKLPFTLSRYEDGDLAGWFADDLRAVLSDQTFRSLMEYIDIYHAPILMNPGTGEADRLALAWDVEVYFKDHPGVK